MGYAALATVAILAVAVIVVMGDALRRRERAWERKESTWSKERNELLDRIMYLSGRPWSPPPEENFPALEEATDLALAPYYPELFMPGEREV